MAPWKPQEIRGEMGRSLSCSLTQSDGESDRPRCAVTLYCKERTGILALPSAVEAV
ncbi:MULTISPECIES: hypothetical protein [unclassified Leptolyngbya]|uniref:hypothetical protein n=1 Tax=unclassified Leptolyngbya TaxID=2650499 RepID=UPI00168866AA|nr:MULTISPECIES: hypothetical protein [unclassified Leptolyngbya]MBD1912391.1 hypothetical protein [Leptolyngbya sp. FACHB-8]